MDKEIEEYRFGYFLATLNGNRRNSFRERFTVGIFLLRWGICEKYQSRDKNLTCPLTGIFRKYPTTAWYICIKHAILSELYTMKHNILSE